MKHGAILHAPCHNPPSTKGERFSLPSGQKSSGAAGIDQRFNPLHASSAPPASLSFHRTTPLERDVRHPPPNQHSIQTP